MRQDLFTERTKSVLIEYRASAVFDVRTRHCIRTWIGGGEESLEILGLGEDEDGVVPAEAEGVGDYGPDGSGSG